MKRYLVEVEYTTTAFTFVQASSDEEAVDMVQGGDYEDLYGEQMEGYVTVTGVTEDVGRW